MKICYGMMLSSKFEQSCRLIDTLNVNDNQLVILVDKKSEQFFQDLYNKYSGEKNIHFILERFDVSWGGITTSEATVSLIKNSLQFDFDYFTMVSESCLPLYPDLEIKKFFEKNKGKEFIDVRFDWTKRSRLHLKHTKPYTAWQRKHRNLLAFRDVLVDTLFGWAIKGNPRFKSHKVPTTLLWFSITKSLATYMVKTIEEENLLEAYKDTLIADEHIFAEVIYKSPFYDNLYAKNVFGAALLYCDWKVLNAPKSLTMKDYKKMYDPTMPYACLYARKFDMKGNPDVVDKIYENRDNKDFRCPF